MVGGDTLAEMDARRKLSMRILPLLACASAISAVEKTNLSLAAAGIMADLNLSEAQFGLAAGIFFVPYSALSVPPTMLARHLGPRRGLALICATFGSLAMLTAFVSSLWQLILLRFMLGFAEAPVLPFIYSLLGSLFFDEKSIGTALGEMSIYSSVVSILMGPAGALFLSLGSRSSLLADWQMLLLLEGALPVLLAVAFLLLMPDNIEDCSTFLADDEVKMLRARLDAAEQLRLARSGTSLRKSKGLAGFVALALDPRVIVCIVNHVFYASALYGSSFFTPLILSQGGKKSMAVIALLQTFPSAVSMFTTYAWSWNSDRCQERVGHMIAGHLLGALALLVMAFASASFPLLYTCYVLKDIGTNAYNNPYRSYQADILPVSLAAMGFAVRKLKLPSCAVGSD